MLVLLTGAVALRVPWRARVLDNWDSSNFSLAMERFDLASHQPHPPGYILYVAVGKLFNVFFHDPNNALVALSITSFVVSVFLVYMVGGWMFGRSTGIVAAIILIFSPLAWFHSEVALSYLAELPWVILGTGLLYQLFFHRRYAILTGGVLAVGAGFRTDVFLFLGPLWFVGIWRTGWRTALWSLLAAGAALLSCLSPLIYLSGGFSSYFDASQILYGAVTGPTNVSANGMQAFRQNLMDVWKAVLWFTGLAAPLIFFLPLALLRTYRDTWTRLLFLLVLPLPALVEFLFVYFGHPGYAFIFGGTLLLLLARSVVMMGECAGRAERYFASGNRGELATAADSNMSMSGATLTGYVLMALFLLAVSAGNSYLFLKATKINHEAPFTGYSVATLYGGYSAGGLSAAETNTNLLIDEVRRFEPGDTMIVNAYPYDLKITDWRRTLYYLPEFRDAILWMTSGAEYSVAWHHTVEKRMTTSVTVDGDVRQILFIGLDGSQVHQANQSGSQSGLQTAVTSEALPAIDDVPLTLVRFPAGGSTITVGPYTIGR